MAGRSWRLAFTICAIAPLLACAAANESRETPRPGGFLPEPQLMHPGGSGEPALLSLDPDTVWYAYTKMILEPVTLWTGPYSGLDSVPPAGRKALANAFYSELHIVASQLCEMVDKPSPGTLIVSAALLEVGVADPALDTISATPPQARLPEAIGRDAFNGGAGSFTGRAVFNAVIRDASSGAVLWQAVDRRPADAAGTPPLTSWRDVDYALKSWAAKFGNWMSLIGACS